MFAQKDIKPIPSTYTFDQRGAETRSPIDELGQSTNSKWQIRHSRLSQEMRSSKANMMETKGSIFTQPQPMSI